jgi:hypothetical protein
MAAGRPRNAGFNSFIYISREGGRVAMPVNLSLIPEKH